MKFMVEHSDGDWKDFNDSTWFVPKTMFLRTDNKQFFIFNFLYTSQTQFEYILSNFKIKLEHFSKVNENNSPLPVIREIKGNSPKDKKKWKQLIDQALESIENRQFNKVVLARKVDLLLSGELNFEKVISKFRSDYNTSYLPTILVNHFSLVQHPNRLVNSQRVKYSLMLLPVLPREGKMKRKTRNLK